MVLPVARHTTSPPHSKDLHTTAILCLPSHPLAPAELTPTPPPPTPTPHLVLEPPVVGAGAAKARLHLVGDAHAPRLPHYLHRWLHAGQSCTLPRG
jgi:hypothetical protein